MLQNLNIQKGEDEQRVIPTFVKNFNTFVDLRDTYLLINAANFSIMSFIANKTARP